MLASSGAPCACVCVWLCVSGRLVWSEERLRPRPSHASLGPTALLVDLALKLVAVCRPGQQSQVHLPPSRPFTLPSTSARLTHPPPRTHAWTDSPLPCHKQATMQSLKDACFCGTCCVWIACGCLFVCVYICGSIRMEAAPPVPPWVGFEAADAGRGGTGWCHDLTNAQPHEWSP